MASGTSATGAPVTQASKVDLRQSALARRDGLPFDARIVAAHAIAARGLPVPVAQGAIVSGFMPIGSEIDPLPLMRKVAEAGARLALPVVQGRGKPLIMRAWRIGAPLTLGEWKIEIPPADAPEVEPDILIVPLAAFDRTGHRIGYGAGYYDRTLALLRGKKPITAIGIGFSVQEVSHVPATEFDQCLDFVMTERETIDFAKGAAIPSN